MKWSRSQSASVRRKRPHPSLHTGRSFLHRRHASLLQPPSRKDDKRTATFSNEKLILLHDVIRTGHQHMQLSRAHLEYLSTFLQKIASMPGRCMFHHDQVAPRQQIDHLVAGLSAANALRLSTQIPRRAEYAVVSRPPSDTDLVHFVNRSARRSRSASKLSPTDVAALEVLDGWDRVIETGPREAMARLTDMIRSGRIDPSRLARASKTEPGSSRARLRYLLRNAGMPTLADKVRSPGRGIESKALAGLAVA